MFGRMVVELVVQLGPGVDLQTAVAALLKVAENVEIVRWIEFPGFGSAVLARTWRPGFWYQETSTASGCFENVYWDCGGAGCVAGARSIRSRGPAR